MLIRCFDLLFATVGLIVLIPFILIISIWIVIDTPGGVFYIQKRVGKNNADFDLLKFRTMYSKKSDNLELTVGTNDSRITTSGKFLRKYKIDELPQLLNVLKGEMSLVGPRPEVRKYVSLYDIEQMKVLNVKPGITDTASIEYSNENELLAEQENPEQFYIEQIMPDKIRLNMGYIENPHLINYFSILFKTFRKIF